MMKTNLIFSGLIRLHILHHAAQGSVYGLWLIEELGRHGYRVSPGTLYPILHSMERAGYLRSDRQEAQGRIRRCYTITPSGSQVLGEGKTKVRELFGELFEEVE
jgi:DNA-binding PadR family transcriptional regulator